MPDEPAPVSGGDPHSATAKARTVRSWLRRMEVDPAVVYAVLTRAWQVLSGPVSVLIILEFYSGKEQGLYYMFANLVLWHGFVELGLQTVITTIASHDWAELQLNDQGAVTGSASARMRLASLARSTFRWYRGVALLFSLLVGGCGYWLLSSQDSGNVAWHGPWVIVVLLTAPCIWLSSQVALLEGCNQLGTINRVRCAQAVIGSLAVWTAIGAGLSLWATAVSAGVRLLWDVRLVYGSYGRFFRSLPADAGDECSWRNEIWPLQWRMAIRSMFAHLGLPILLPVVYSYYGAEASGLVGMTLTILQAVEGTGYAWMQTRIPRLGMLVARREFAGLDRLFRRVTGISTFVILTGGGAFCALVSILPDLPFALAQKLALRMAGVQTTALLLAGMLAYHFVRCLGVYVYVHKRDPFLIPQIIGSSCLGFSIWYGGRTFGQDGAAIGYLLGNAAVFLPMWTYLFVRCRREWH